MKRILILVAVFTLIAAPAFAQVSDIVELTRTVMRAEKKAVFAENLWLTDVEGKAFWPVYNEYEAELSKINGRVIELLGEYAETFDTLSDAQAKEMLDEVFSIRKKKLSLRKSFAKKFGKVKQALNTVLRGGNGVLQFEQPDKAADGHGLLKLGDLRLIQRQIDKKFEELGRQEELQTEITERGLVVHIMESALFSIGSADMLPQAEAALDLVYDRIKGRPNHIRVEGHTDDRQINTSKFSSNWDR